MENRSARVWLMEGNSNLFDHVKCFQETGVCYWNMQNCRFELGDIAYIFISSEKQFKYKTKVVEINVKDRNPAVYCFKKYRKKDHCVKLELLEEYNGHRLGLDDLIKHNYTPGSLQHHLYKNIKLIQYIEDCFVCDNTYNIGKDFDENDAYREALVKKVLVNRYERSADARRNFLEKKEEPYKCEVCGMDFESIYGERGKKFIHVHHLNEISNGVRNTTYKDLAMVCPNCHAMLHRQQDLITPEKLKKEIAELKKKLNK